MAAHSQPLPKGEVKGGGWTMENSSSVRSTFGRLTLQEASQSAERKIDNEKALRLGSERQGLFILMEGKGAGGWD